MANGDKSSDGFLIVGAEEVRGARANVVGITTHLGESDLQQFVNSKLQKPLRFSYEVVTCDGVLLGVIHVPLQDGWFYLKSDYGKLRRNIVYYRQGSSTAEMSPDEFERRCTRRLAKEDQPTLELQFAHIERPTVPGGRLHKEVVGIRAKINVRYSSPELEALVNELSPPAPRLAVSHEHEYFQRFAKFVRYGLLVSPLGFVLTNAGSVTATDIRVHLSTKHVDGLLILPEDKYPSRPLNTAMLGSGMGGAFASHVHFSRKDIVVSQSGDDYCIEWTLPKALPHLPTYSTGVFFIGNRESGDVPFHVTIYAENLRKPVSSELVVQVESTDGDLTAAEIMKFSQAFSVDDIQRGTGRV